MIKTLSTFINKELKYIKEIHLPIFSFNSVQYLLEDCDSKQYLLVIAFDNQTKETIEIQQTLFKGIIGDVYCALFTYPLNFEGSATYTEDLNLHIKRMDNNDYQQFSLNAFNKIFSNGANYVLYNDKSTIPVNINNKIAFVGTWMNHFGRLEFLYACKTIFNAFKKIKRIEYKNLLYNPEIDLRYWRHNDFYLPLPETIEELKSRISSKSRHNLKRERRIIADDFGSLQLVNLPFNNLDSKVIDLFYKFKCQSHGVKKESYDITKLPITDVYLLKAGDEIKGIALSCEQSDIAFIENHTFDSSLRQYSFGQVLYDMYLERLIEKGKIGLALSGGNLDYKKRYGSICYNSYSGTIKRHHLKLFDHLQKVSFNVNDKKYHRHRTMCQLIFR